MASKILNIGSSGDQIQKRNEPQKQGKKKKEGNEQPIDIKIDEG